MGRMVREIANMYWSDNEMAIFYGWSGGLEALDKITF